MVGFLLCIICKQPATRPHPHSRGRRPRSAPIDRPSPARLASIVEGSHAPRAAGYPQRAAGLINISTATRNAPRAAGLGMFLVQMQRAILSTGHATAPAGLVCLSRYKHRRHQTTAGGQRTTGHGQTTTASAPRAGKPAPPAPNHGPRTTAGGPRPADHGPRKTGKKNRPRGPVCLSRGSRANGPLVLLGINPPHVEGPQKGVVLLDG